MTLASATIKPLIVISVDGFRWDYSKRGYSPQLTQFGMLCLTLYEAIWAIKFQLHLIREILFHY